MSPSAYFSVDRRDGRQDLPTPPTSAAAIREAVEVALTSWADEHGDELQAADDIKRNNSARQVEEEIDRTEAHLAELRTLLARIDGGEDASAYSTTYQTTTR